MPRISKKELDSSTSPTNMGKIKTNGKKVKNKLKATKETLYSKVGSVEEVLPEDNIMAKSVEFDSGASFYVRFDSNGQLYNPHDPFAVDEAYRGARNFAKKPHELKSVPQKCFAAYVEFLSTRNPHQFKSAQKEM